MAKKFAVALKPTVNVRRGPNMVGGFLGTIKVGEQLEIVEDILEPLPGEKWAQVIWPKDLTAKAYVCMTLASGTKFCELKVEPGEGDGPLYAQGYNDALDDVIGALVKLRK